MSQSQPENVKTKQRATHTWQTNRLLKKKGEIKMTEFNSWGEKCVRFDVCWLIPLFLRRNSPGPTPNSHARTHAPQTRTHAHTHTKKPAKASFSLRDLMFQLSVSEKPTVSDSQLHRQTFKMLFLFILYRSYILFTHRADGQCGDNWKISKHKLVSVYPLIALHWKFSFVQFWTLKLLIHMKWAALHTNTLMLQSEHIKL